MDPALVTNVLTEVQGARVQYPSKMLESPREHPNLGNAARLQTAEVAGTTASAKGNRRGPGCRLVLYD